MSDWALGQLAEGKIKILLRLLVSHWNERLPFVATPLPFVVAMAIAHDLVPFSEITKATISGCKISEVQF
jgi:hypothetical protein